MDKTFHIITFGCQMNVGDSDWLARALVARGWRQAAEEDAWLFVVNTCSVRDKPEQKVYSELGRLAAYQRKKPGLTAAVGGCVAQQIGRGFFDRFPFVRLVFGSDGIAGAPDALEQLAEDSKARIALLDFLAAYPEREDVLKPLASAPAPAPAFDADAGEPDAGPAQAFVNIMQGCDNFCAYCIVPYTRGRQKSRAASAVLDECRTRVEQGAREITLLGQNVNSYGLDPSRKDAGDATGGGVGFAELLRQVAAIPGLERLRFTTSHPKDIDPAVIRAFGELPNLCPSLHLPLQAGSDAVLKRMGRKYDRAKYLAIVAELRAARPDIALTTDLIVGFPGETEEDFQATLEMMERVRFESSFSFRYSDRPGVAAVRMTPKVEESVAQERLLRLQSLQNGITKESLKSLEGRETVVLLEAKSRRQDEGATSWRGRDEAGQVVNIRLDGCAPDSCGGESGGGRELAGLMVRARIVEAKNHSLIGEKVGQPW
ncbi:MAG TPA: tRNA (N6-isopentenyl adenosine(37)-C2)-methylthiotransferase MiaB [Humidesulfovibrio sp.]|uniref:tRNA (N6-isopentenyl adenosine(37)-C2)-methylthiotransferase MiaB n=1 Tax=Humidesulfovibrio sp. TaxID=2910988 RepID=UPI002C601FC6|nr:tRNA (N6-isopentenyl adenosine(37)-C2)-methylthiotransferase MiaB [Humidesulfovibrio sp.]HWR02859.1 tRNA (N6-isopentenyl adenosine(37)-C2)-methylthiotransferase MiaB [Humidesulfovibrio sp.]